MRAHVMPIGMHMVTYMVMHMDMVMARGMHMVTDIVMHMVMQMVM